MIRFFWQKLLVNSLLILGLVLTPVFAYARVSNDPDILQPAFEQIGLYRAWDYTTGSSQVVVAVIDNGFDMFHPDLLSNVWQNPGEIPNNGIDDEKNGFVDDLYGWNFLDDNNNPRPDVSQLSDIEKSDKIYNHGSIVAGIIGATGNNNQNGAGVNWKVKLMNVKVLGNNGYGSLAPLGQAVRYAVDNGAHVINISMVGDNDSSLDDAIRYAYAKGVVVVAAMGNYNGNLNDQLMYPTCSDVGSSFPMVLGISAVNEERRLAYFSNSGSKCVDLTAPGVNIGSTLRYSPENGLNKTYSVGWNGTSFAAPFVSGAAALVKSVRPEWKAQEIYQAILTTTHHTPSADEAAYAQAYGKGLLQIHRAVAYAQGLPLPLTMFDTSNPAIIAPVLPPTSTPIIVIPVRSHVKTFVAVGTVGQMRDAYNDSFDLGGSYERPEAKNIESAAAYGAGASQIIVTVKAGLKNVRVVSVYNNKWQLQNSWNSNFTVPVQVAVGQRGNGQTVIALAPTGSSKIIYRLYDANGISLGEQAQTELHQGVSITMPGEGTVTAFTTGNKTMIKTFGSDFKLVSEFAVTGMGTKPFVALGEVTGDSSLDIVVGSGPGVGDQVQIYAKDGTLQRTFSPFGDGRKNGVSVVIVDADANGTQDLLTYSANTSGPIRAWTARAKNAGEWSAPFTNSFFLLPR